MKASQAAYLLRHLVESFNPDFLREIADELENYADQMSDDDLTVTEINGDALQRVCNAAAMDIDAADLKTLNDVLFKTVAIHLK